MYIFEFYPLNDAAKMVGYSTDGLIHLGASGQISIVVCLSGKYGFLCDKSLNDANANGIPEPIGKDRYGFVPVDRLAIYESERGTSRACDLSIALRNDNSGNFWRFVDSDYIPLNDSTLYILHNDIIRLLEPHSKPETVNAVEPPKLENTSQSTHNWKIAAWGIAEKIHAEKPSLTVEKIAQKTYAEMLARNDAKEAGMTGRSNRVISATTILRHGLRGIKS